MLLHPLNNLLMVQLRGTFTHILAKLLRPLPPQYLESLLSRLISAQVARMTPGEALRLLFRLDGFFYSLQGQKAVEYGGGIHTKHRHTHYHDFFISNIQPGERILDVGCASGVVAYEVAERAMAYVVGMDVSAELIAQARERYPHPRVTFMVGDVRYQLPDGPIDVVILSNVLEHLTERPAFLSRLMELLSPSRFLIRVPLFDRDWRVPLKRELGVEWRLDLTHEVEYTVESFSEEMVNAGLRISQQEVRWGELWAVVEPHVE